MTQDKNKPQSSESPDYEWWVDFKSVWELREAANLYLGFDPEKGGTFYDFNELLKSHERGLILTDSETVWDVKTLKRGGNAEWEDVFYDSKHDNYTQLKDRTSLMDFMNEKIASGQITRVPSGDADNLYFAPKTIVEFFIKAFLNEPPLPLLIALKPKNKGKNSRMSCVKNCYSSHSKEIISQLKNELGRLPNKVEIAEYMKQTYLPDVPLETIKRNFHPSNEISVLKRQ